MRGSRGLDSKFGDSIRPSSREPLVFREFGRSLEVTSISVLLGNSRLIFSRRRFLAHDPSVSSFESSDFFIS